MLAVHVARRSQEVRVEGSVLRVGRGHDGGLLQGVRERVRDVAQRLRPVGLPADVVRGVVAVDGRLAAAAEVAGVDVCRVSDLALLAQGLPPVLERGGVDGAVARLQHSAEVRAVPRHWRQLEVAGAGA